MFSRFLFTVQEGRKSRHPKMSRTIQTRSLTCRKSNAHLPERSFASSMSLSPSISFSQSEFLFRHRIVHVHFSLKPQLTCHSSGH